MHEASLHERNSFITLTYNDENLPKGGTLDKRDYVLFMKRLRKHTGPNRVRFYMCGEYGETTWRPHYHACIFGWEPDDKKYHTTTSQEHKVYTSDTLDRIWAKGHTLTADVTFQSAAYVARYCMQKRTGPNAKEWYTRNGIELLPEYNDMSRGGRTGKGLAAEWLDKYHTDIYNHGALMINGKETQPPKYYDNLYKEINPERLAEIKLEREERAYEQRWDNTPARLRVKEQVNKAAITMLQRNKQ